MSVTSDGALDRPRSLPVSRLNIRDFGTLIGLLLIVGVFAAIAPGFLSQRNLVNILQQSSINACLAWAPCAAPSTARWCRSAGCSPSS